MKRSILILGFFLIVTPLQAQSTLKFSAVRNFKAGLMMTEILKDAYGRLNIQIEVEEFPGERALKKSNSGEVDGELFRIPNVHKKYTNLIMIPVVIYKFEGRAYSKTVDFPIAGWNSLQPYKVGVQRGILYALRGTEGMNRQVVNTSQQLYKILEKGRVDLIISDKFSDAEWTRKLNVNGVHSLTPPLIVLNLHHYLHKKHEALVPEVTKAIQASVDAGIPQIMESKTLEQLRQSKVIVSR